MIGKIRSNKRIFLIISHTITILLIAQIILGLFFYNWAGIYLFTDIGWIFIIISIIMIFQSYLDFKGAKKTDHQNKKLVDSGMFAIIRHPMYLSFIIMTIGIIFISQYWLVIVVGLMRIIMLYYIILEEEKIDLDRFGLNYKDYQKKVPRLNFIKGILGRY